MSTQNRLLTPEMLPATLWVAETETMHLPPDLSQAYTVMLERKDLLRMAEERDPDDAPVGGLTKESTDQHFAQAFSGSVARAQLAVIDPKSEVIRISDAFINTLAGNSIVLSDAPCGAGAAAFAFLTTVAELRARDVLPRQPLEVFLIGAEPSVPARSYATELLNEFLPFLERQAIFVRAEFHHWDVLDRLSNTDLITRMSRALHPSSKRLLVVANFNSFLEKERRRKDAEPQLEELFRHASGDKAVVIWIEPQMNAAVGPGGLFVGVMQWIKKWFKFARLGTDGLGVSPFLKTACKFQSPLAAQQQHQVRLAVMRVDLGRFS